MADPKASWQRLVIPIATTITIIGLSWWFYSDVISWFPSHIHAWTQSDRLALAYGYLDNGLNFFLPCTYNVFTPGGITGVDFPIHEYIVALIMKITGIKEPVVFRAYTLAYSLIGYLFLYLLSLKISRSHFKAAVVVLFAFTCPIITYYQAGFIPSATSLANCFIGFYFYMRYRDSGNYRSLYAGVAFLTLAALPRLSVNVVVFAVLLVEAIEWYIARKIDRRAALAFAIGYVCIALAFIYKIYLNTAYGSRFLTKLLPADDASDLISVSSSVWERWSMQLMTSYHWLVFGIGIVAVIIALARGNLTQKDRPALLLGLMLIAGSGAFYLALAKQFVDHEYYFMDSLYQGIMVLLILGLKFVRVRNYLEKMFWPALFIGAIIGMIMGSRQIQELKYADTDWDRGEVTRRNFTGADSFLDSLGIAKEARILVYEAHSTNVPLLLMGRKGYTILNSYEENIRRALDLHYDYIVIQDEYIASDVISNAPWFTDCVERIDGNGRISVFSKTDCLTSGISSAPVSDLLGFSGPLHEVSGVPGQGADSMYRDVLLNMESTVSSDVEFGPTMLIEENMIGDASHILVTVEYNIDEATELPVNYSVDISASFGPDSLKYKSHPVKITKHGEGVYMCTFDLTDYRNGDGVIKVYIWNRYKRTTGINQVSFGLYRQ